MTTKANTPPRKRLSAGEIIELALTRPARNASEDVEINENAKHELQLKVSASRHDDETLADCAERAWSVFKATRERIDREYQPPVSPPAPADNAKAARTAAAIVHSRGKR